MPENDTSSQLVKAAKQLRQKLRDLTFSEPVTHVYNPLEYAWKPHEAYLKKFGQGSKQIVFIGMNPGPFGMVQTGVPFGEVKAVKLWLEIEEKVGKPPVENPKRPVDGFACKRSEVSGRRLWGLFAEKFDKADNFFTNHFVLNYCPLAFIEKDGRNRTPDKLPTKEVSPVYSACDEHLARTIQILKPQWLIGVGAFAEQKAQDAIAALELDSAKIKTGRILHPSPSNPAANHGWADRATKQLMDLGIW